MKEYKIITSHTPIEIGQLVSQALKDGWQLIGGVSTTAFLKEVVVYQIVYSQALVR